jgi:hypothetical protein
MRSRPADQSAVDAISGEWIPPFGVRCGPGSFGKLEQRVRNPLPLGVPGAPRAASGDCRWRVRDPNARAQAGYLDVRALPNADQLIGLLPGPARR